MGMGTAVFSIDGEDDGREEMSPKKPTAHIYGLQSPGPNPLASFLIRISQFLLNMLAMGFICATEQYKDALTGGTDAKFGEISFANFLSFRFLIASCFIAALYELSLSLVSVLKMCDLLGGRKWSNASLWLQVAGDTIVGQLVFAGASAGAMQALYNEGGLLGIEYGQFCSLGYNDFCVLMEVSVPLAFLVALAHLGSFWVFARAAYKTYFEN